MSWTPIRPVLCRALNPNRSHGHGTRPTSQTAHTMVFWNQRRALFHPMINFYGKGNRHAFFPSLFWSRAPWGDTAGIAFATVCIYSG